MLPFALSPRKSAEKTKHLLKKDFYEGTEYAFGAKKHIKKHMITKYEGHYCKHVIDKITNFNEL